MFSTMMFKLKKAFFKNDKTVILYSTFCFFLGIIAYLVIKSLSSSIHLIDTPLWGWEIFLPFWVSTMGMLVTIMVMLKINMAETQTGEDFMENLIAEIGFLNNNDQLKIITPNLNVGQYKYQELFNHLSKVLTKAKSRGVVIEFYCLPIELTYLNTFDSINDPGDRLNFLRDGKNHNSSMLTYIYNQYQNELANHSQLVTDTISELKVVIQNGTIIPLNDNFIASKMVGFLSNKRCYIGKYSQERPIDGKVNVSGKVIELEETVECLLEYYMLGIKEKFK